LNTQRRTVVLAAAAAAPLALAGCASLQAAPPPLQLRLPPAALGRSLALMQQLTVWTERGSGQFEALLEADESALQLAVLAGTRPVARLYWDGRSLYQQMAPQWPPAVTAERVLSDLTLVLWPAAAVAAALPAGWSLRHDDAMRELRWRDRLVQRLSYPTTARVELEHLVLGYRLRIDSLPVSAPGLP
jgi:hypothetical protein